VCPLVAGIHPVFGSDGLQAVEEGVVVEAAEVLRASLLEQGQDFRTLSSA
jgi:hypothetical protein